MSLDLLRRDGEEEQDFRFFFLDFSCFVLSISFSIGNDVSVVSWRMKKQTKKMCSSEIVVVVLLFGDITKD